MPLLIILALLAVPYLEFLVFLEVSHAIGGLQAFLLTILTAVFGVYLIRQQGIMVLNRIYEKLQRGESPLGEISQGFFLLIAGIFFLLPGFITDTIALLLAIGPVRSILEKMIVKNIDPEFYNNSKNHHSGGIIIEAEYTEEPDERKNIDHKE